MLEKGRGYLALRDGFIGPRLRVMRKACLHIYDRFYHPGFRAGECFEVVDHGFKSGMMGNPWVGVDFAIFDQIDDAGKILRQGIATGKNV